MDLPIEVRGQATEREHLEALTVMQRRVGSGWRALVLCLGVPLCLVAVSVLSGGTLEQALVANLFWLVFGALLVFVSLPIARRETVRSMVKGNPDATAPTLYRFTAEGFEERECPVEVTIKWGSIQEALWTETALLLFIGRTKAYIVPRDALVAAGKFDAIRELLGEHLGAQRTPREQ